MKLGIERFEFYLVKLEELIDHAAREKNPGLWLYINDTRTPIFMLEGLAKLYAGLHNKKRFLKIKEEMKLLEDALGSIDYYDSFAKEFVKDTNIPVDVTDYVQGQAREKIQYLNELLSERNWIGENADRIKKIRKKLRSASWLKDDKEVIVLAGFYKDSIEIIISQVAKSNYKLTEIETQVHELRRKLRWLSIYPRALQGAIQLTDNNIHDEYLNKYLTPEIINSPFNKMPEAGVNKHFLMLEKNYFLALSWMIAALGKLKDNGLKITVITESLQQVKGNDHESALNMAYEILGPKYHRMPTILSDASAISETYFKEKNLANLMSGIATIS